MALEGYSVREEDCERDKLASLKKQLKKVDADFKRLSAAIAFLETNPGAQALVNSI